MRKVVVALLLVIVFAVGLSVGLMTPDVQAKNTRCWTVCDGGVAMECCRIGPIVECRVLADGCN